MFWVFWIIFMGVAYEHLDERYAQCWARLSHKQLNNAFTRPTLLHGRKAVGCALQTSDQNTTVICITLSLHGHWEQGVNTDPILVSPLPPWNGNNQNSKCTCKWQKLGWSIGVPHFELHYLYACCYSNHWQNFKIDILDIIIEMLYSM